jgi:hypothetical protein
VKFICKSEGQRGKGAEGKGVKLSILLFSPYSGSSFQPLELRISGKMPLPL